MRATSPPPAAPRRPLVGRSRESTALDRLLTSARGGRGGVLVLHGEAGIGKTALLERTLDAASGFTITSTSGVEAESELAFAAAQQLCTPVLHFWDGLPQPQRMALGVAFGLTSGPAPDPYLVGLAVLGLMSEAAEQTPLV